MKTETRLFLILVPFFLFIWLVYGFWSDWEPVGTAGILLLLGLVGMIGFYFALVARRIDPRPEDDAYGEVEQGAGEQGVFAPWSWWPLALGVAAAICFTALAVGWWLFWIGGAFGVVALVGWVFEYSRGQHAH
ncbi:cytochrome c oxidase subunit 4 [Cellulomonas carbonis]|uniref:Cytochrome c oxidase polypeptide 4 n=1 Tax=Cellulomonas carbonis T26 TaxID=947969 RepID=A0A0A0BTM8_9CELL|nr:cytochrome c oxidase subunit 4 [Cellulomonas carbonis]KGM10534.1 cytochrome C oxidase subunit IV [Cellulomonas carbonis T26]MDT0164315.1 cytochrome c oxidase subunit 4 [Actinotalea sp. AC32]GGB93004.1 putative cytochrome c oxidase polypeptide 4 [Cellulomonas carbonis]